MLLSFFSYALGLQESESVRKTANEELPVKETERVVQQNLRRAGTCEAINLSPKHYYFTHLRKLTCICGSKVNIRGCNIFMYKRQFL